MMTSKEKTSAELRSFGLIMALILAGLGAFALWRGKPSAPIFLVLSGIFGSLGIIAPNALREVDRIWTIIGEKIGAVMTFVLLTITYFAIITPTGILLRLFGKDLLHVKLDPSAKSYWVPADREGSAARHFLPY